MSVCTCVCVSARVCACVRVSACMCMSVVIKIKKECVAGRVIWSYQGRYKGRKREECAAAVGVSGVHGSGPEDLGVPG